MVEIETRVPLQPDGGICEFLMDNMYDDLEYMLGMTDVTNEEYGTIAVKRGSDLLTTGFVEGESDVMSKSITGDEINNLREQVADEINYTRANKIYEDTESVALIHTHPGGDPSPSEADLLYLLSNSMNIHSIQSEYSSYHSRLPVVDTLLAASEANGEIIMTGFSIVEDLPSRDVIEYYQDETRKLKTKTIPKFFDDEDNRKSHMENVMEAYDELIDMLTGSESGYGAVFDKCHARHDIEGW